MDPDFAMQLRVNVSVVEAIDRVVWAAGIDDTCIYHYVDNCLAFGLLVSPDVGGYMTRSHSCIVSSCC